MNTKPIKGLRSYYPTDKGPIDTYQLGHDGRIEYIAAEIGLDHLKKGVNTTDEWKKWAKERGTSTDEPGLIISKRLGGSGIDSVNLFPKNPALDKTAWGKDEETAFNESTDMKKWKKIKFTAKFEYPEDDSLRPSSIEYCYDLPSGTVLHNKVTNEKAESSGEKNLEEEEEESEYEYEYEEEEEEETAEEPTKTEVENISPEKPSSPPPPASKSQVDEGPRPSEVVSPPKPAAIVKDEPIKAPTVPSTTPTTSNPYTYKPPPYQPASDNLYSQPKTESPASTPQKQKSPTPTATDKGANNKLLTQSDLIEMIPLIGSLKLLVEVLKALASKNTNLAFWKAFQCGISVLGDFYFMRAFARHGSILVKPITEEKLIGFANKAESQIIIFGACTAGNQFLSSLRRILS